MTPFIRDVSSAAYGVAEPWASTGPRAERLHSLADLAVRVEALRRGRRLGGWRGARFVWGPEPSEQRRKLEVDVLQCDGKVAITLSLLVQGETLDQVRAAIEAAAPKAEAAA
ncbi:MAG TPA: hypothetical protein VL358_04770 [Caulobacteraceae bacterium]|jgi:hypothetical protein|nr:hypothetical protein [Caulobacteraceae bacterium]